MQVTTIEVISDEVDALIRLSRQYQAELYPPESIHQQQPGQLLAVDTCFLGVYCEQALAGIGAVMMVDGPPVYGEIKNLFVDPRYRGRGVSRVIMNALEQYLIGHRISLCRLETGPKQPESIALYKSLGYSERSPYGDYGPDPFSVFMEKVLRGLSS